MNKRVFLDILIFLLIIFSSKYIYLPSLFLSFIFVPFYWEAVIFGFLIDVLYGPYSHTDFSFNFPIGILIFILILISIPLRERIRFYNV